MPFVVASWLGLSVERVVAGLASGSILPPDGAPPGWRPPGAMAETIAATPAPDDGPAPANGTGGEPPVGLPPDTGPEAPVDLRAGYLELARQIDASLDEATFDALWRSGGDDDAARAARVGDLLWRTVSGAPAPDGPDLGALGAEIAHRATRGTLVSLAAPGSAALADAARADPAVLGALAALDGHAFVGVSNGAPAAPARFDASSGEALVSDAWIDDRARFVAWRQALSDDAEAGQDVGAAWRFVDRTQGDAATIVVGPAEGEPNQVVFARDDGDDIDGGATVDRLHGGRGDDTMSGAAGDDLVEGGLGDDLLSGDAGGDRVDGGAGDDRLAGGEGNDALDGGTGDDALDGGRGDDRLAGGEGHDVYSFARGDGIDVVVDTDADGEILLDGERLTGMRSSPARRGASTRTGRSTSPTTTAPAGRR